jgi:hypothetical protein
MHAQVPPYQLVQPPMPVTLRDGAQALLLARWRNLVLVLVADRVDWVATGEVVVDWAPWGTAAAANA